MLYSIQLINENKICNIYPQFKMIDKFTTELDVFEFTLFPLEEELNLDLKKYNGLIPIMLKANGEDFRLMYLTYYKCVNTQYNPKNYKYMFQCVSPTFKLQRITLPNKLITQPITDNKRTVWEELNKIMEVYAYDIIINPLLEDKMNIPCPELSFTKSTLHEILISLFAVCGLAPKMEYLGQLDYIDLKTNASDVTNWSSEDLLIRIEKSNNISEYADAFDYDVENAISDDEDITTQWLSPTSENAIVGTDDFIWKVPSDIYELVKVELFGSMTASKNDVIYVLNTVDITDYVIPKSIYDTKYVSSQIFEDSIDYKRNLMYYENNIIGGGAFSEDAWLNIGIKPAIQNIIRKGLFAMGYSYNPTASTSETDYRNFLMKVTYKTQANGMRVKIVKSGVNTPKNTLISNQDDAFIDIVNFGNQKQELINRTGNELIVGNANFDLSKINYLSELNIAKLGDRVDENYIITQREMQFNENNLIVNYYLAKDYIFLTGYSGLNQLKRFTSIDTKNTLVRNDNILYNYIFEKQDADGSDGINNLLIENYGGNSENGINLHLAKTTYDGDYLQDYYILVNSQNKVIADSIVANFKFETNVKVGDSISVQNNTYLKEPIKYTNNNGEFEFLELAFGAGEYLRNENNLEIVRKYPRVDSDEVFNFESYLLNKDNREITSLTLQFRFLSNENQGIIVYKDLCKYTNLTPHNATQLKFYAKFCKTEEEYKNNLYKQTSTKPIGEIVSAGSVSFENNKIKINNIATDFGYWVIGICDEKDNLLLGINHEQLSAISTIELFLNKYIN